MYEDFHRIARAVDLTQVIRTPKQQLATFGITNLKYYVVTEPIYKDLESQTNEVVVRNGQVIAQKPNIVTPGYMLNLEGFSPEAREYMEYLSRKFGVNSAGLLYQYNNNPGTIEIVDGNVEGVAEKISRDLDQRDVGMAVVLSGLDELWDVSLFKFIYEFTASSSISNAREMETMGLLEPVPSLDVPKGVIDNIDELFRKVKSGLDPSILHRELLRWGLFEYYEERFLNLFK
mgnify:CR=1 FL=1|tara:strand:- start:6030 stop:6725 length:696 start_codon:yes stop_codon:yes gene_type:complete